MIDIIKKAKNITRWSENLFTFVEIKDKNLYNMKNKNVKLIKERINYGSKNYQRNWNFCS